MSARLLPATALSPGAPAIIVLGKRVPRWLTETLKRVRKGERITLRNAFQHQAYMTKLLSSPLAIWTLTSLNLPKVPTSERVEDIESLVETVPDLQFIHIKACIVHVDMVLEGRVSYKLTSETVNQLIEYQENIFKSDVETNQRFPNFHAELTGKIKNFIYSTSDTVLEGLQKDGTGKFPCEESYRVKNAIMELLKPPQPLDIHANVWQRALLLKDFCGTMGVPHISAALSSTSCNGFNHGGSAMTDRCFCLFPSALLGYAVF